LHEGIQDLLIAYKQQAEAPKSIWHVALN
jgi:hypothetical protein